LEKTGYRMGRMRKTTSMLLTLLLCFFSTSASAWFPARSEDGILTGDGPIPVVGENQFCFVQKGDTLIQLARTNGLGYDALNQANPKVDPWLPASGHLLLLPYETIFPGIPREGITVNLADLRLYLLWQENGLFRVRIYPVGIGDQGWETPEGDFSVLCKVREPGWTVPASIRKEHPELPKEVPPGPNNPLGDYWIGFSPQKHGIHGTNRPYGVGRRVSHGCIRLYPEDIRNLFGLVKVGTPVHIVYRPVKVGIRQDTLFVEVHPDYLHRITDPLGEVMRQAAALGWRAGISRKAVLKAVNEARGVPVPVSKAPLKAARPSEPGHF
ncbi:MAG: L,D-transpeptidase family protein, partial [Desulfuromonadales bacterium]